MLTGRISRFSSIRKQDGLSGFPRPYESEYDLFTAGHAGTALSLALGLAKARLIDGDDRKVIAVIGDGAFGNGMVYEAMNTISGYSLKNLIVILNDNSMSISKSVGGLAQYLLKLRTDIGYSNTKRKVRNLINSAPLVGEYITDTIARSKALFRRSIYDGRLFEEFGFNYIGPIDGHDIFELNRLFKNIKDFDGPLLVHVKTVKGKGYPEAEANPGAYHGLNGFNLKEANDDFSNTDSFSSVFGKQLLSLADEDESICAITAAMKYATGLNFFKSEYPERFFDVGIAEEHAVTFSAGLAKGDKKPVFAIYSTFLQRGYDQLFQDIAMDNINVLLAVDRAGLVGEDGETHHGLYDVTFLSSLMRFTIVSPANYQELKYWLSYLINFNGPKAIRYPRGSEDIRLSSYEVTKQSYDLIKAQTGEKTNILVVSYGRIFAETLEAKERLLGENINIDLLKLNVIFPIDSSAVEMALEYEYILFVEEGIELGGLNEHFLKELMKKGFKGSYEVAAITNFVRQGTIEQLLSCCNLDSSSIVERIKRYICEKAS